MRLFQSLILSLLPLFSVPGIAQNGIYSLSLSNPQVTAITQDRDGYLWFGTIRGLNRFNGTSYTVYYASGEEDALNNDHILSICEDTEGTLWIGTECGLNYSRNGVFRHLNSTVYDPITDIVQIDSSTIAYSNKSGRFQMDIHSLEVLDYQRQEHLSLLPQKTLRFTDRDGGIWEAGPRDGWTYHAQDQPFEAVDLSDTDDRISHLIFDRQGYLWLRIDGTLCSVDAKSSRILWKDTEHYCSSLIMGGDGHLTAILDNHLLNEYVPENGQARLVRSTYYPNELFSLGWDDDNNLWISEASYLVRRNPDGEITRFPIGYTHSFSYIIPSRGTRRLFILGLTEGLLEVQIDGSVKPLGPGFQNVSSLLMARDGTFWMGTYNDGIIHYDENNGTVERFGREQGIVGVNIKSMVQDSEGYIWCSTAMYISRYDPWSHTFSAINDSRYRRDGKFYDLISASIGPDGRIYFGGSGGLTVVDPKAFQLESYETQMMMEAISVNEKPVWEKTPVLDLDYRSNTLGFRFAGINYLSGLLLNYAWKLDGYDRDWHYGSHTPEVAYTRLPAGHYTFQARVREQNGQWSSSEIALPVVIHPAPWASPWAKALYWLLGIGALLSGITLVIRMRTQKERLELAGKRAELNQQHIDFMTNLSHEFRTPLTMILAPAKELEKSDLLPREKELSNLIVRNAERLKALSEQLLSSHGGRGKQEELKVRENDLSSLLRSIADSFRYAASQKEQELTTDLPDSDIAWFDTEKVSKILGNLVSNAIKYTPEEGHICLALKQEGTWANITVTDDGIGILPEKRGRIFERFDRLGAEDSGIVGSGIGLNFAKSMALLHKGELSYEPNGSQGSIFRFSFPTDAASYPGAVASVPTPLEEPAIQPEGEEKEQTVLIVEDTLEIRLFLRDLFKESYNVLLASNGLEALDHLKISIPDLVLSDVIMPHKTGFSLCADIKSNPDWSHLPVVLLTARADAQSSVEGMKAGADAYVSKPFDPDFLKATVESLLRNRRLMQEKVRNLTSMDLQEPEKADEVPLTSRDKALLQKMQAYMDGNLQNEDTTDVSAMAREMGMSYSSFYAKVKALTGETPKAYITTYRMNVARQLLLSGEWNVSEVADKVGASSPFTFSREFKKYFGYPPSQVTRQ